MMTDTQTKQITARQIMTADPVCVRSSETVLAAAKTMAEHEVGALPICGEDDKLKGMVTDRDIVIKVLAQGKNPESCQIDELMQGEAVTIGADDGADEIMRTMAEHHVRRLPVIDGHKLVGIVAQADVARALGNPQTGELVEALSYD